MTLGSERQELRTRYLIRQVDDRLGGRDLPLLSVSAVRGVVPRSELTDDLPRADDLTNYKVCMPGDIVVNRMSAYQGALGMSRWAGIVSPDYVVLRPVPTVEGRWLHHVMRSPWFVSEMTSRLRGIGSVGTGNVRTPRVSAEEIGDIRLAVPSLSEQRSIADYLDTETTRIDALIAKKRRQIQLLQERLSSVREATFDSRPGWPLKRLLAARMAYGVLVPRFVEPGDGVPMMRITNLDGRGGVRLDEVAWIDPALSAEFRRTIVQEGDVILSVVGSMGRSAAVPAEAAGWNLNRPLARLQLQDETTAGLVWQWTQTKGFLDQAHLSVGSGTAQPTLNLGDLSEFSVGLPQDRQRWPELLDSLRDAGRRSDDAKDAIATQLDLLVEHRQALITAAVTGELAVPGVAA